ncbi:hypothetical protein V1520DRAFT_348315 [Lipomyces starkeyi]|uniref:Uncharacterized protein n=1 Tax=Lipomyces starkeyi NRRL Y-11557 TaxID=675824 RepID=A0A1E3Q1A1_LIPST|nr:hypothetical protein LIPSTDRAFT_73167 [Lipomyces starkeyi NRRL Y-11557]
MSLIQAFSRINIIFVTLLICTRTVASNLPVDCTPAILWLLDPLLRRDDITDNAVIANTAIQSFNERRYHLLTRQLSSLFGGFTPGHNASYDEITEDIREVIMDMMSNDERDRVECLKLMLSMSVDSDIEISSMINSALTGNTMFLKRDGYKELCQAAI